MAELKLKWEYLHSYGTSVAFVGPFQLEAGRNTAPGDYNYSAAVPGTLRYDFSSLAEAQLWAETHITNVVRQMAKELGLNIAE